MPIFSLNEYQQHASRTIGPASYEERLDIGALGLGGEAGEAIDHIKKFLYHGVPLDKDKLVKELGDVLWYIACIATAIDVPMSQIATSNIQKLLDRYPEKFVLGGGNRTE